jgi:hypothetical protein
MKSSAVLLIGLLLAINSGIEAQIVHTTVIKDYKPTRINKNVLVENDPVTTELDLNPIIDFYTPDKTPIVVRKTF